MTGLDPSKLPTYIRERKAETPLSDTDYMHIALKNEGSNRFIRALKIFFAGEEKKADWVTAGKHAYTQLTQPPSDPIPHLAEEILHLHHDKPAVVHDEPKVQELEMHTFLQEHPEFPASKNEAILPQAPPAYEGWKNELPSELVQLMEQKGLKPVNPQEMEEIKTLLKMAEATGYPSKAITLGLVDYLRELHTAHQPIVANQLIAPYCFVHLSPVEAWQQDLKSKVPAAQQPFLEVFFKEMALHPKLFPVNSDEVIALENMIALGAGIATSKENGYTKSDVAAGCVSYLAKMREEKRSFAELIRLSGLITTISPGDLYPFCFDGMVKNLAHGNPEGKNILAFFRTYEPIHGRGVPITDEGRKRLGSLLDKMGDPSFAQNKGVQHPAMPGKLPTILFDLNLTTIEDFNNSSLTPKRTAWLFDQIQKEQFLLPSVHEVIAEVNKNPIEAGKNLAHPVIALFMGNPKEAAKVNQDLDHLVDRLAAKDPLGMVDLTKQQLDKAMGQLQLTESVGVSASISTAGALKVVKEELTAIRTPENNQETLRKALDEVEKSISSKEKENFTLARDLSLKRDLSLENRKSVTEYFQNLQQTNPKGKKGILALLSNKEKTSPQENIQVILETLNAPRKFNEEDLKNGLIGEGIKAGLDAFAGMQKLRNRGEYDDEEGLKKISDALKPFQSKAASILVGIASHFPKAIETLLTVVIEVVLPRQIRNLEKQLLTAKKEGDGKAIANLESQLKLLNIINENHKEIVKIIVPITLAFLKHHKLHEHRDTIKAIRTLLNDPHKELNQEARALLVSQVAKSAELIIKDVELYYPNLMETVLGALFDLPKQGKVNPQQVTAAYSSAVKEWTAGEQENLKKAANDFQNQLVKEFPLKEEAPKAPQDDSLWGAFSRGLRAIEESVIDYDRNQKMRELSSHVTQELSNHPFFANHFTPDQLPELMLLMKEGLAAQGNSGYSPEVIAIACRLYIETELQRAGKLDVPMVNRIGQVSVQERLLNHGLQAMVELAVRQSNHPHKEDPYLARTVATLLSKEILASQTPLNEVGRANIAALTAVLLDPQFAKGKPLDLPIVVRQFKYLFPSDFNTVAALNQQPIPQETLRAMVQKSQILVERGVNLGLLKEGVTQNPEEAVTLLTTPIIDAVVKDPQDAASVKQEVSGLVQALGQLGQVSWIKEQMGVYLEKMTILKAVQVDISISTQQATTRVQEEKDRLNAFMSAEGRLPNEEEAAKMGAITPRLVNLVKEIALVKEIQNGQHPNDLVKDDPRSALLDMLPKMSKGLQIAKPFLGMIQQLPGLIRVMERFVPQILKWIIQDQIALTLAKDPLTDKDRSTIEFLQLLLEKDHIEKLTKIGIPLINGILGRHDWTQHNNLVDQIIKIGDPSNQSSVNEIELMKALLDSAGVVMHEVNTHYSEAIPDLLNAIKAIQVLK